MLGREACPERVAVVDGGVVPAERVVATGLAAVVALTGAFFTPVPFVVEGVGEVRGLASAAAAATGLFVAVLARNGARGIVVVVAVGGGGGRAVDRAAGPVVGAVPLVGAAAVLRVGTVDVLEARVEALGAVVLFAAPVVAVPGAVDAPRGLLAVGAVFEAVALVGATEERAPGGTFLSAVEAAPVVRIGARVVEVAVLPPAVVRGLASTVTLALGLTGASLTVGLVSAWLSVESEGMSGSTGDASIAASVSAAAGTSSGALSDNNSFSSSVDSSSV